MCVVLGTARQASCANQRDLQQYDRYVPEVVRVVNQCLNLNNTGTTFNKAKGTLFKEAIKRVSNDSQVENLGEIIAEFKGQKQGPVLRQAIDSGTWARLEHCMGDAHEAIMVNLEASVNDGSLRTQLQKTKLNDIRENFLEMLSEIIFDRFQING